MDNMDKSVQHINVLSLPVTVQQDTVKGTWVDVMGLTISANALPLGVTEHDANAGEMVAVTVMGTASVNMVGIANTAVLRGDAICYETGAMTIKPSSEAVAVPNTVRGIMLYDAAATGHAEVLLR
ncbi:capsid cement protein [Psychrobacter aquaticus]|uniref:DUF2190 family protein n=1 Tax=Psychrobacter aquaticus CMS 56 TaxID=1354303 RepID=U4TBQ4_9GAMM|nr:capsid cement protein [Psychrobacter aquaticus]ERL56144.1 hypothetical protein M917_0822 [Psychrobacter aquaticus CMS 56]